MWDYQKMMDEERKQRQVDKVLAAFENQQIEAIAGGLPASLVSRVETPLYNVATLDNSTFHYASDLLYGLEAFFGKRPSRFQNNPWIGLLALGNIIECAILFDTVYVGPDSIDTSLHETFQKEGVLAELEIGAKTVFALLSIARQRAIRDVETKPGITEALHHISKTPFDKETIIASLKQMTPEETGFSPHHWEHLNEDDLQQFNIDDITSNYLNKTLINTFAIDDNNAGRYWYQDDFIQQLSYGRSFSFPESKEALDLLFLSSVLIRSNYYLLLSSYFGTTYYADYTRSAILPVIVQPSAGEVNIMKKIIQNLEASEQARNETLNQALQTEVFSFPLPILLTNVLLQASSKDDILKVTLQMRASAPAKRFRRWSKELQASIEQGDRKKVEQALGELKEVGIVMAKEITAQNAVENVDISAVTKLVGYLNPLVAAVLDFADLPAKAILRLLRSRKFAFLSEVQQTNANVNVLQKRLTQLFAS